MGATSVVPAQLSDHITASALEDDNFLSKVRVVPWGVLGTQLTIDKVKRQRAIAPDASTVIVDPAGLPYIQRLGPKFAGGASGEIYKWLGIGSDDSFPLDVKSTMTKELDATFHAYEAKKVI